MVIFSLLVHESATFCSDNSTKAAQPADSICLTEDLLNKFDNMVLSEETNTLNQRVAAILLCRQESGIFESLSELVGASLIAYPDEDRAATLLVQLSERILLKSMTSPLNAHLSLSNRLLMSLLENTDFNYHSSMAASIM
jgi:hypothetical protein